MIAEPAPVPASSPLTPLAAPTRDAPVRIALFLGWLAVVAWLAAHHVFWRDEVRALNIALSGDGIPGMLRALQGEGHPALWYLLLRIAHDIVPVREVLPAVGLLIGIAAAALFAWRAPFRPLVIATVLFGAWFAQEYTVMARNYGISALLMFAIADRMAARRCSPLLFGVLLFLLCSTNVPSVLFAAGFLLFRLVEILRADGLRPSPALKGWVLAAGIAALGVLAAFFEVYPPWNDAAASTQAGTLSARGIAFAALNVAEPMSSLLPEWSWTLPGAALLLSILVIAAPFSLARSPAGFLAAILVLPALLLFFQLVYLGGYRHQALYIAFLLSLHWMVAAGLGGRWTPAGRSRVADVAGALFLLLLAIQVVPTAVLVAQGAHGIVPSRARELGALLHRPDLRQAVVIGEPDVMIEALSYYAPNPTWLVRERKWGRVVRFTWHAQIELTLDDILATARRLHAATGRPVVIVVQQALDPAAPPIHLPDGYNTFLNLDPASIRRFLGATHRIASFGPVMGDESYEVYLLGPGKSVKPRVTAS